MKNILKFSSLILPFGMAYDYSTDEQIHQNLLTQRQVILRNLRTVRCGINILYQYKIKFNSDNANQIHDEVAEDIYRVCLQNDGLYVKFGQGMASADHILPPAYFKWLCLLQDKAKQVDLKEIKQVIEQELNLPIDQIFRSFDEKAIASASIAQVHKAVLKSGEVVAVKIQKPCIQKQFAADMFMHWLICGVLEYAFDLPLLQFQGTIEENLEKEIDFRIELENGEQCRYALQQCDRNDVYVPQYYKQYTQKRVLVSEWIDGIKITHTKEIEDQGISVKNALSSIVECFAEQIFVTGFVHCDPHPGNLFVRKHPKNPKTHQVVLLDFGLCIKVSNQFRLQYAEFWKALFLQDKDRLKSIVKQWGIKNEELFAMMQLQRPYKNSKPISQKITKDEVLQMQLKMKQDIQKLMRDTDQFPQELLFINRNMNLVRSVNKRCGSLVNRINIMARYASYGASIQNDMLHNFNDKSDQILMPLQRKYRFQAFWFETRLFLNNLLYKFVNIWMKLKGKGVEDLIDEKQKKAVLQMYGSYGFKTPDENTFDA